MSAPDGVHRGGVLMLSFDKGVKVTRVIERAQDLVRVKVEAGGSTYDVAGVYAPGPGLSDTKSIAEGTLEMKRFLLCRSESFQLGASEPGAVLTPLRSTVGVYAPGPGCARRARSCGVAPDDPIRF